MTTLDQLQALPDDALIERVATEVMRYEDGDKTNDPLKKGWWFAGNWSESHEKSEWNPIADWNHTMEVVSASKSKSTNRFVRALGLLGYTFIDDLVDFPDQRRICLAALLAVSPSKA